MKFLELKFNTKHKLAALGIVGAIIHAGTNVAIAQNIDFRTQSQSQIELRIDSGKSTPTKQVYGEPINRSLETHENPFFLVSPEGNPILHDLIENRTGKNVLRKDTLQQAGNDICKEAAQSIGLEFAWKYWAYIREIEFTSESGDYLQLNTESHSFCVANRGSKGAEFDPQKPYRIVDQIVIENQ